MDHAKEMMVLFAGNDTAYGTYDVQKTTQAGKKVGKAETKREAPTIEHWRDHLDGKRGLGIVPIMNDDTCWWGCIDVDEYGIDHEALAKKLASHDLPLFVCTTKSGGAHIFAFFKSPVAAEELQPWLKSISAGIGYGDSEIFPKQTKILKDRGDVGNWLNMPYFDTESTTRHLVAPNGKAVPLADFIKITKKGLIDPAKLWEYRVAEAGGLLDEGPPCLQVLCQNGFPEGTRNNGLFNLGIFAQKKYPEKWKEILERLNQEAMSPPLPADEVTGIVKQLEKKDYEYKCNETPICSFCNSSICRTRKFGVGAGGALPSINGLTKLDTDPPIWFLTVEGQRIELTTEQLQQPERFQRVCMESLNMMPPKPKQNTWQAIVQGLMDNVIIIEQPEDVKMKGQFVEMLESFTTARAHRERKEDIVRGLPYTEKGHTYFRLKDFIKYAKNQGFPIERNFASARIRDFGGKPEQFWVAGQNLSVWVVDAFDLPEDIEGAEPKDDNV